MGDSHKNDLRQPKAGTPAARSDEGHLAEAAMALLACRTPEDVFEVIFGFIRVLVPDSIVIVNETSPDSDEFIVRAVYGLDDSLLARASSLLGFEIVGGHFALSGELRNELTAGRLTRVEGGVAELSSIALPKSIASGLAKTFGIHDVYTIGIADGQNTLGNFHILARSADAAVPAPLVEAFAHHCYSALSEIQIKNEMNDRVESTNLLLDNMIEGLALHEMILGEHDEPLDYRFLDVNPAFERITGLKSQDLIGHTVLEVLPGIEPMWIERYGAVATTGIPQKFDAFSDEIGRHFEVRAFCPRPGQFVTVFSDITERIAREQALLESEADLKKAQHYARIGSWTWDIKGDQLKWSDEMYRLFGIDQDTFTGRVQDVIATAIHPDDRAAVERSNLSVINDAEAIPLEYRIIWPDGSEHTVWAEAGELLLDEEGNPALLSGTVQDITDRRRTERELEDLNQTLEDRVEERTKELTTAIEELTEANEAKSRFLRSMSHELRTPLNSVIGFSSILADEIPGKVNQEQKRQLAMINHSGRHLLSLINDILDLSKIDSGAIKLGTESVDLHKLLTELAESVRPSATTKGLSVDLDVCEPLPFLISDPTRISQILINLLGNAIKFTQSGGVTLRAYAPDDHSITVSVSDTGPGIAWEEHDSIFDEFERGRKQRKDTEGTGLGLAISRGLAQVLGGSLSIESRIGEGSTFTLTLPVAPLPNTSK